MHSSIHQSEKQGVLSRSKRYYLDGEYRMRSKNNNRKTSTKNCNLERPHRASMRGILREGLLQRVLLLGYNKNAHISPIRLLSDRRGNRETRQP